MFDFYFSIVDISIAAVDLLQEMTDVDTLVEGDEGANDFVDALVWLFYSLTVCIYFVEVEKFKGAVRTVQCANDVISSLNRNIISYFCS